MTADRDAARDQLAAALRANDYREATHAGILDALLPVVERIANERAAAELRAAAEELHLNISGRQGLRDRADELDPS